MTGDVGTACLVVGLLAALMLAAFALVEIVFARTDLSFNLVARYSSHDTPLFYKLTAMWSSQEGSLLLWALLLSVYTSVVLFVTRKRLRDIVPWATASRTERCAGS